MCCTYSPVEEDEILGDRSGLNDSTKIEFGKILVNFIECGI